eukprot:TRINITY_DN18654_c0_g1_i1.p1 TRINITY_DN18654_c0_g1~~TRINITY_DN18654_c0_g1_i1.p1  ORF type:complete len:685 (-),score=170.68 TRINITY_DN18654_c0_g1_i1:99-2078(-)
MVRKSSIHQGVTRAELVKLFADAERLEEVMVERFDEAKKPQEGSEEMVLHWDDAGPMVEQLAKDLGVNATVFGDLEQMFWRYDFSGTGALDKKEAVRMLLSMLRRFRDERLDPAPGVVRLNGQFCRKDPWKMYDFGEKVGEGGQGAVYLAKDKTNAQQVVIKLYDKSSQSMPIEDISTEFELMMKLKHPRIARYFDIFQDDTHIYVVQEPYFGGDLSTAVHRASEAGVRVDEKWMAGVLQQLAIGVAYMHSNEVMHCDLKEANAMITSKDFASPQVVVIDFGMSNTYNNKSHPGGTPGYMPVEVWDHGLWTPKGDVFSVGIIMLHMRTGINPLLDATGNIQKIRQKTRQFVPRMKMGSEALKKLVVPMLKRTFTQRPTMAQVAEDPWFDTASHAETDDMSFAKDVVESLERRSKTSELKRALFTDLVSRQNLAEMRKLNDLFSRIDKNNDGVLSADELRHGLKDHFPAPQIESFIAVLCGNGGASYEEFMGQLLACKLQENDLLAKLFNGLDVDHSGYLEKQELVDMMNRSAVAKAFGTASSADLLSMMDQNHDGKVSFTEFRDALYGRPEGKAGLMHKVRSMVRFVTRYTEGDKVEYYVKSQKEWVKCIVCIVDKTTGAVQVNIKPGLWIVGKEFRNLRSRRDFLIPHWLGKLCCLQV